SRGREENRRLFEDLVIGFKPTDSGFEFLDFGQFFTGTALAVTSVNFSLAHPPAHRLLANTNLASGSLTGGSQCRILLPVLGHQPHRTGLQLIIDLPGHVQHPFNSKRCGTKPGTLQNTGMENPSRSTRPDTVKPNQTTPCCTSKLNPPPLNRHA